MKHTKKNYTYRVLLVFLLLGLTACEDYLEIDLPDNRIINQQVFNNEQSAQSAIQGIYNQLANAFFAAGGTNSVTVLAGLSADHLITTVNSQNHQQFEQNEITIQNAYNYDVWSSAYQIIYQCNAAIEGLQNSTLPQGSVEAMVGEVSFIRAFVYFYLVNMYGEIPLVLSTDYRINADLPQSSVAKVYIQIIEDLFVAKDALQNNNPENTLRANVFTVQALLARVYLYQNNWADAEAVSTQVIQNSPYQLEEDLDQVFLSTSNEAIWQISPIQAGSGALHTRESNFFIIEEQVNSLTPVSLSTQLVALFNPTDQRKQKWVGSFTGTQNTFFYPYKYKVKYATTGEATEYSMVLRLAEQYLIRAEARTKMGDVNGAVADLDQIRTRAGLGSIASLNPSITLPALTDSIAKERRRELFTEWGHRWLDLKRWGTTDEVLAPQKSLWEATDQLYPIPEQEVINNPNLTQNPGY
ncbi:MAG: RagB/SusD family nutrient uptake outer membrane protein [Mesonia sp.]|uniref:RagB/SusD family nutrient uptake outer membrane protein n=1 Tax=Mesonia sp. TaxID=1960830 RepID=UPI003F97FBDA